MASPPPTPSPPPPPTGYPLSDDRLVRAIHRLNPFESAVLFDFLTRTTPAADVGEFLAALEKLAGVLELDEPRPPAAAGPPAPPAPPPADGDGDGGGGGGGEGDLDRAASDHQLWLATAGREGRRADLSGRDLSGRTFPSGDWRGAIFVGTNFAGSTIPTPNFGPALFGPADEYVCDLTLADFRGAVLDGADFRGAVLLHAKLAGAGLTNALFQGTVFGAANNRGILTGAVLERANLAGADLIGLDLARTNLKDADLTDADLRQATNLEFDSTRIRGASLTPYRSQVVARLRAWWVRRPLPNTDDRWSVLRRNYSGTYFVVNLLLFAIFLLPLLAKAVFWSGVARAEAAAEPVAQKWTAEGRRLAALTRTSLVDRLKHEDQALRRQAVQADQWLAGLDAALAEFERSGFAADQTARLRERVRRLAADLMELSYAVDARTQMLVLQLDRWAERADQGTVHWHETTVLGKMFQADQGFWYALLAVLLAVYNVLRGGLTYLIAPLRDEEERSGYTPDAWTCAWMYWVHHWGLRWLTLVSYGSFGITVVNVWSVLNTRLLVPVP
jgi:uncharacterized protein YjbI with pentapeptide repeats